MEDPSIWPATTLVIRGGEMGADGLRETLRRDGRWSVISEPGVSFTHLAASVRNNRVRSTTLQAVYRLGGKLEVARTRHGPPYHCDLSGLTPEQFDSILGPAEPNPVPRHERWKPA